MRKTAIYLVLSLMLCHGSLINAECITVDENYFAAISEELFDEAMDYVVKKDFVALKKLFDTNQIFLLKAGVSVDVKTKGIFSGKVKIRPVGSRVWFWTVTEAVHCY